MTTDAWRFAVTWNPEQGALPLPILRLFRHRSTVTPGSCVMETDKGHSTYYERAVRDYLARYHPGRGDVTAAAHAVLSAEETR